ALKTRIDRWRRIEESVRVGEAGAERELAAGIATGDIYDVRRMLAIAARYPQVHLHLTTAASERLSQLMDPDLKMHLEEVGERLQAAVEAEAKRIAGSDLPPPRPDACTLDGRPKAAENGPVLRRFAISGTSPPRGAG